MRQPRRTMRATVVLRRQRSPTRTAIKRRNSARSSVAGTSRPLLARALGYQSACAGVAMSRIRSGSRGKSKKKHANRLSVPKNIMKKQWPNCSFQKHPVGRKHNKFLRRITLRDLTVTGKCNKSGWSWANSGLTKYGTKTSACKN